MNRQHKTELARLGKEFATLVASGPTLPGTLTHRHTRCGRAGCRCVAEPPQFHGPYWSWTRKVDAKTVTRYLSDDEAHEYQVLFDKAKRLRALVAELEALGLSMFEAGPRSARRPRDRHPASPA